MILEEPCMKFDPPLYHFNKFLLHFVGCRGLNSPGWSSYQAICCEPNTFDLPEELLLGWSFWSIDIPKLKIICWSNRHCLNSFQGNVGRLRSPTSFEHIRKFKFKSPKLNDVVLQDFFGSSEWPINNDTITSLVYEVICSGKNVYMIHHNKLVSKTVIFVEFL